MNTPTLTTSQLETLRHTQRNQLFCGEDRNVLDCVAMGLMEFAGRKSFVPDRYFRLTDAGRQALAQYARAVEAPR